MLRKLSMVLVAFLVPGLAWAAKTKVWHHHAPSHFEKAILQHTVLTSEGTLRLGRELNPLAGIEVDHIWALVEDSTGALWAATGNEGKLFRIGPAGKATLVHQSDDSQILSLVLGRDGTLYAGTGPSGLILSITPQGKVEVLARTAESYVWSLVVDPASGDLLAGTGPRGRVLRVTQRGELSEFYNTRQDHVLSLAIGSDNQLYAGTSKQGLIYRINGQGKGFVVFDAPQTEVRTLLATRDGVYAGTSSPTTRRSPNAVAGKSESTPVSFKGEAPPKGIDRAGQGSAPVSTSEATSTSGSGTSSGSPSSASSSSAAPSLPPPSSKENSVYFLTSEGLVREVFREKAMIQALAVHEGKLLIATGSDGQLFEVDEATKERTELARLEHRQVHCLCRLKDGTIVLGSGDAGQLHLLGAGPASKGTLLSEVLDARGLSRWGALRWQGETPEGTRISVACRSGNVAEPDETWSDWSAEQTDGRQATISVPPARFLQYRITLERTAGDVTPALHSIALRYQPANQAPEIGSIEVPDFDAVTQESPRKLKLRWTATDGNEDELSYSLYCRKEGWQHWVELAAELDKREFEWDTTTTPAGVYRLKVVASDQRDNPPGEALTGEKVSNPFVVDHVPPEVSVKVVGIQGDRAEVEARAADGLTRLVSAAYSVDGKKWVNAFPQDGLFDSKDKRFRFHVEGLRPGAHVLVLRVTDAAGNSGSSDVLFTVKEPATAGR